MARFQADAPVAEVVSRAPLQSLMFRFYPIFKFQFYLAATFFLGLSAANLTWAQGLPSSSAKSFDPQVEDMDLEDQGEVANFISA